MSPTMHQNNALGQDPATCLTRSPRERPNRVLKHHRRTSSGSRTWTEEEVKLLRRKGTRSDLTFQKEDYLIRTREHKMPYKHIAAHLKKTELACRLHYHQMLSGGGRRRRTESISSTSSNEPMVSGSLPIHSPPSSPELTERKETRGGDRARARAPQRGLVSLLPKIAADNGSTKPRIDHARLHRLYALHRDAFWAKIAADYAQDADFVSPRDLEAAFLHRTSPESPPTPGPSPEPADIPGHVHVCHGFQAINQTPPTGPSPSTSLSPAERCSVSALLT